LVPRERPFVNEACPSTRRKEMTMSQLKIVVFLTLLAAGLAIFPTGATAVPDPGTSGPHGHNGKGDGNGGLNSPTGIPGDSIDDPHSGKVDCLGDGDSGQGNDERFCTPPGCDGQDDCADPA
jgi:hypothetical protein